MKRFAFRLDSVLRVRRLGERAARARLLAAQRDLAAAEAVVAQRQAEVARLQAVPLPASTPAFLAEQALRSARVDCLALDRLVVEHARATVRAAQAEWTAAAAGVGALERLEERHRQQHRIEAVREMDALTDELVTSRHRDVVA